MNPLFQFFIQLALLRRAPQDLPVSTALLVVLAVVSVVLGAVNGTSVFGSFPAAFGANLVDLALTFALLFFALKFTSHPERWVQTTTAFLGLGTLAGLVMLLVRGPAEFLGIKDLAVLVDLIIAVWLHVALGGVLRHALEIPLMAGVLIVLAYTMLAFNVIVQWFPMVVAGS